MHFIPGLLQEPSSIEKVAEVDAHIGVAMSGLTADARTLIDHARVEAQQHSFTYNEAMPVESLTQSLCDLALRFGEDDEDGGGGGMVSGCMLSRRTIRSPAFHNQRLTTVAPVFCRAGRLVSRCWWLDTTRSTARCCECWRSNRRQLRSNQPAGRCVLRGC